MTDILIHTEDGITTLTFNRLERKNSITAAMYAKLADALEAAAADTLVRVVVFQGHETVFSAGNDIGDFLQCAGPDFSGHEFGVNPCQEKGAWNAE
jgi:enoyl-CoA hydratase/carnithine racemase